MIAFILTLLNRLTATRAGYLDMPIGSIANQVHQVFDTITSRTIFLAKGTTYYLIAIGAGGTGAAAARTAGSTARCTGGNGGDCVIRRLTPSVDLVLTVTIGAAPSRPSTTEALPGSKGGDTIISGDDFDTMTAAGGQGGTLDGVPLENSGSSGGLIIEGGRGGRVVNNGNCSGGGAPWRGHAPPNDTAADCSYAGQVGTTVNIVPISCANTPNQTGITLEPFRFSHFKLIGQGSGARRATSTSSVYGYQTDSNHHGCGSGGCRNTNSSQGTAEPGSSRGGRVYILQETDLNVF